MDIEKLRAVVSEVLQVEPDQLKPETVFEDLPDYDSITTLTMMVALDDEAGLLVSQHDIVGLKTFGDLINLAKSKA